VAVRGLRGQRREKHRIVQQRLDPSEFLGQPQDLRALLIGGGSLP